MRVTKLLGSNTPKNTSERLKEKRPLNEYIDIQVATGSLFKFWEFWEMLKQAKEVFYPEKGGIDVHQHLAGTG